MACFALWIVSVTLLTQVDLDIMPTLIKYSRLELMGLMPVKCQVPLSTYETLRELNICGVQRTQRGCRGGGGKCKTNPHTDTSTVLNSTKSASQNEHLNLSVWNAQSVGNKTNDICEYVITHDIDILCLTETWMKPDDPVVIKEMSPPGYAFINTPRVYASGDTHGGIGILYKTQIGLCLMSNLDIPVFTTCEYTVVSNMSRSVYIVTVYRPTPSRVNKLKLSTFLKEFEDFIDCVNELPGKVLLVGDLNVHFDEPSKSDVKRVSTFLSSVGMSQLVSEPTHKHKHTLDVIVTRDTDELINGISVDRTTFTKDHFMVNCSVNLSKPQPSKAVRTFRKYRNIDHEHFSEDLSAKMMAISQKDYSSVDDLLNDYNISCLAVLDTHAPQITRISTVSHHPGWFSDEVMETIRERRRCERKWRKSQTASHYEEFLVSRQNVKDLVLESKTVYYKNKFENSSCIKDMYNVVKELLNKDSNPVPDTDNTMDLANSFGEFFIGKVNRIRDEVDKCAMSMSDNVQMFDVSCNVSDDISFDQFANVSDDELLQVIAKCPNKSCVLDVLPTWLLKQHVGVLLPTLVRIVNMSLSTGVFPTDLRRAVITPVLKKPSLNRNELRNYRPVANLQLTSKIIEKCVVSQLQTHIDTYDLAEPMQSAYRAQHSTETALACVHNDFSRALDNQKAVLLVMLDLSAAFDTVDRKILLQRVTNEFGIVGTAQQWISSYLEDRSFRVTVDGAYSKDILLQHGLPQGSVIGPLGFVFYTHTVGRIIRHHQLMYHIYADDIQIYLPVDPAVPGDVACGMFKISRCVEDINSWMIRNKLKLNPDKTEFFIMSSSYHRPVLHDVSELAPSTL